DEDFAALQAVRRLERGYDARDSGDFARRGSVTVQNARIGVLLGRRAEELRHRGIIDRRVGRRRRANRRRRSHGLVARALTAAAGDELSEVTSSAAQGVLQFVVLQLINLVHILDATSRYHAAA